MPRAVHEHNGGFFRLGLGVFDKVFDFVFHSLAHQFFHQRHRVGFANVGPF